MSIPKKFSQILSKDKEIVINEITDEYILKKLFFRKNLFLKILCFIFPPLVPGLLIKPKSIFVNIFYTIILWIPGIVHAWKMLSKTHEEIIKRTIIEMPYNFSLKVDYSYSATINFIKFNELGWESAVLNNKNKQKEYDQKYLKLVKHHKRDCQNIDRKYDASCVQIDRKYAKTCADIDREHASACSEINYRNDQINSQYQSMYMQYEANMQQYSIAKSQHQDNLRRSNSFEFGAAMFNGPSKPSKPSKPKNIKYPEKQYPNKIYPQKHYPLEPKSETVEELNRDNYWVEDNQIIDFKNLVFSPNNENKLLFNFIQNAINFNKLFDYQCLETFFQFFIDSIYSCKKGIVWRNQPIIRSQDYSCKNKKKLKINENQIKEVIKEKVEYDLKNKIESRNYEPNMKFKDYTLNCISFYYKLEVLEYIPFLSIDFKGKTGKKSSILYDYITQSFIQSKEVIKPFEKSKQASPGIKLDEENLNLKEKPLDSDSEQVLTNTAEPAVKKDNSILNKRKNNNSKKNSGEIYAKPSNGIL
jgi:uncharacterized membrane protein YqaE (UPF0057 family)